MQSAQGASTTVGKTEGIRILDSRKEVCNLIKAVMFDMGGTLEELYCGEENLRRTAEGLYSILKAHGIEVPYGVSELWEKVYPQVLAYKQEAEGTLMERKPEQIWPDYAFADIPVDREKLIACSEEIARMWELTYFDRSLRPGVAEMLRGLKEDLGLYVSAVSNTASVFQVFESLETYGIRQYFDDVTLSSIVGYRKPHPGIFKIALSQAQLAPEACAFVGDTISRDVIGSRKMGFGRVFKIGSFLSSIKDQEIGDEFAPDYEIENIYDVYTILKRELNAC